MIATRLQALGADPALVEARLAYFDFPTWSTSDEDIRTHAILLEELGSDLRLVVYATATDMLAAADLDENRGVDVTRWVKFYPQVAGQFGVTQLVLDHTDKSGEITKHAVGSRGKRAKAKVQLGIEAVSADDRATVGEVKVTLTKNTLGAEIPKERFFLIGGGNGEAGGFTFAETIGENEQKKQNIRSRLYEEIPKTLQAHDRPLSTRQLCQLVPGKSSEIIAVAKELAADECSGVKSSIGERGAVLYEWVGLPKGAQRFVEKLR